MALARIYNPSSQNPEPSNLNALSIVPYPDPREDLESRSPNLGPYTTKGTLEEPPLRDLLFGSSRVWNPDRTLQNPHGSLVLNPHPNS